MSTLQDAEDLRTFARGVLTAWGMRDEDARLTADAMVDCDLRGVDTHGVSLLQLYDRWRATGGFNLSATDKRLSDAPACAAIDAQGGLGFPVSVRATELACSKARETGIAAVTVRNSRHFGAAGYYARLGAERGMVVLVATSAKVVCVVPPGAQKSVLGTNPLAYAIPRQDGAPVVFDMATSTAAGNKVRLCSLEGKPVPEGWVVDGNGAPVTDAEHAERIVYEGAPGGLTPLGSTPVLGAYKGYGLALLVQYLGGTLAGGDFTGAEDYDSSKGDNVGHFFLAIDPEKFRALADFEADAAQIDATLRHAPAIDPDRPILLPGDVERAKAAERARNGVPLGAALTGKLNSIAEAAGAPQRLHAS